MRKSELWRAALCALPLVSAGAANAQRSGAAAQSTPAKYEVRVERSVAVPMRDGVHLSTDLYFPVNAAGKLGAVLIRTPYNKHTFRSSTSRAQFFAGQGYAVAVQDVRGKFESEGEFIVSGSDVPDGYDTDSWIAAQSWSNGKIGTYGCSYLGDVQIMQAQARHPNLTAMIPQAASSSLGQARNRYHQFGVRLGGTFELAAAVGWFAASGSKLYYGPPAGAPRELFLRYQDQFNPAPAARPEWTQAAPRGRGATASEDIQFRKLWWVLPITDIPSVGHYPPTDFEQLAKLTPTDPWWTRFGYLTDSSRFDVPALHINSWYDFGPQETMTEWEMLRTNATSALGRDNQFAVIAPTTHCGFEGAGPNTIVGEREVGDATFDWTGLYLKWFDYWLRGVSNAVTSMPKIQYFLMGKGEWRAADGWPIPGTQFTKFYLHGRGTANGRLGDGVLSTTLPAAGEPPDHYVYDPQTPTPSRGGPVCCTGTPDAPEGAFDQSDVEMRSDILVYTSEPFKEGVEVTGPLSAVLYASSDAKDTDFTAKLIDVYPDGRAFNLQEGVLRARYREGFDHAVFMAPGGVYEIKVDMQATGNYFPPGHRVRLEIASANFPRFDRNLNTGGNNFDEKAWKVARNMIYHSSKYPSHVILPIVPARTK
jgi:hypothetical protein